MPATSLNPKYATLNTLLNTISNPSDGGKQYRIFLGAGASVSSGIKSARDMVAEWRTLFDASASSGEKAKDQSWYETDLEYSSLFTHHYPLPAERRDYIEHCLENAKPSFGYLYLADLLEKGFFNTVVTTNFDDLLLEACYTFTQKVRPIVAWNDTDIPQIRLASKRPKIIKIHGDYRFDSLKNTSREVNDVAQGTHSAIERLANESGLIVVGYGGCDRSVMISISKLLENPSAFPYGVYWCLRSHSKPPERLKDHFDDERLQFVRVEGFDALMARLHDTLVGKSPDIVANPSAFACSKTSHLLSGLSNSEGIGSESPQAIKRDLASLGAQVNGEISFTFPTGLLGSIKFMQGEHAEARQILLPMIENMSASNVDLVIFFESLRHSWDKNICDAAIKAINASAEKISGNPSVLLNATLSLIHGKHYDEAERLIEIVDAAIENKPELVPQQTRDCNELNRLQIVIHRGNELTEAQQQAVMAVSARNSDSCLIDFGCQILLGLYDYALKIVRDNSDQFPASTLDWPIIKLLPPASITKLRNILGGGEHHFGKLEINYPIPQTPKRITPST